MRPADAPQTTLPAIAVEHAMRGETALAAIEIRNAWGCTLREAMSAIDMWRDERIDRAAKLAAGHAR